MFDDSNLITSHISNCVTKYNLTFYILILCDILMIKIFLLQEVSLDPDVNGAQEILEKATLGDITSSTAMINSPVMEEVSFISLSHSYNFFFFVLFS